MAAANLSGSYGN